MKKLLAIIIILLAGASAYAKRAEIKDWLVEWQKPQVEEVSYQEAQKTDNDFKPIGTNTQTDVAAEQESHSDEQGVLEPNPELPDTTTNTQTPSTNLPAEYNLAVPFTSQAPKSNWEEPYQELCEEASALMASYYFQGLSAGKVDPDQADADLLKIVDFENSFFGFYKDTNAEQTALLIEAYFQLTAELVEYPTITQIQQAIVDGHPVIVPAAGRELGNPNFTGVGPLYHMFVIKGYTADGFITNDPGTRLGADYFYPYDTVMNALHDWNGGDVANGAKVVIVVKP